MSGSNKGGPPTLRCSSVVVTSGGKSESLPAPQCVLSLSKSSGVLAGHKWSIRHEDLDYAAFRRDNGRYLCGSSGGGNDHGKDDRQPRLVIQTKPTGGLRGGGTWRKFECHPAASSNPNSQICGGFVAALVRMHDKWRARHPQMAQRLDEDGGAGGGSSDASVMKKQQQQGTKQQKKSVARKRTGKGHNVGVSVGSVGSVGGGGSISSGGGKGGHKGEMRKQQLLGSHVRKRKAGDMTMTMMAAANDNDNDNDNDDNDDDRRGQGPEDGAEPMDVEEEVEAEFEEEDKSENKSKGKGKGKPDLCVDTGAEPEPEPEAEAEFLLQTAKKGSSGNTTTATTTANTASTSTTANCEEDDGTNAKANNTNSKSKGKAKTVTPTPTASTASRKEQQTQQQAEQNKGQQPGGILSFFGVANTSSTAAANNTAQKKQKQKQEATTTTTATTAAKNKDGDNNNDDEDANRDENIGGNDDKGDGDDDSSNGTSAMADINADDVDDDVDEDVIDVTDHERNKADKPNADGSSSPTRAKPSSSSPSSSSPPFPPSDTTKTKKNRRRSAVYGSGRPSASSSRARGSIDLGLVRSPSKGGGIGPRSNKRPAAALSASSSVNEDPFTFDDGKATPTSYLPATDLSSRLMGSPSPNNRSFGRSRSSSPIKSPGRIFLPTKSPRNTTPSRIGPTSSGLERPPGGGRRLGGKELLAQQKRAVEEPLTDEEDYKRVGDQSDEATVDNDEVRSWDANRGDEVPGSSSMESVPATPRVRRTAYESIMPGRLPRSRRGGWSHDVNGSPVRPRGTSISSPRRPPKSWGSSLRATAKKGTGIVREAPYDNFGNSPDSSEAVKNLDDRFGRCEPPAPMEEDGDDLYDTDDEKSRKKMERLANNPYYPPGSRIHNRDRLEDEQQSKYFNDHQMSTADSALLPRGPMRGGLGRGNRNRPLQTRRSGRFGGTPYQQRARRGQDDDSHRESWSQMAESGSKSNNGFFDKRRRNGSGFDRAAERAKDNVATGLKNLGNTCYLNSSLQTLFSVPGFAVDLRSTRDLIMAKYDSRHGDESNAKLPLTNALIETAVDLGVLPSEESSNRPAGEGAGEGGNRLSGHRKNTFANPKELKKVIDALTDWFHGYQQQDAHEAIGYIIDALHDELAGAKKLVTDETSGIEDEDILLPTDKYFRLEFREQNVCVDCGFTSGEITSVHRNLPVAISKDENKPWTVQETLERHFAPETRDLKCEKCPCEKVHHTTLVLKKPGALLLSFKRFVQEMPNAVADQQDKPADKENENVNGGGTDDDVPTLEASAASSAPPVAAAYAMPTIIRSKVRVCLQEKVSLEPFMLKDDDAVDSTTNSNTFDAVGVVHHIGSTPHSGHYTADAARNRDLGLFNDGRLGEGEKKWVTFDDTATTFTDRITVLEGETSQRNTYMAMYVSD